MEGGGGDPVLPDAACLGVASAGIMPLVPAIMSLYSTTLV